MKKETIKIKSKHYREALNELSNFLEKNLIGNKIITNGNIATLLQDMQDYELWSFPKKEELIDEDGKFKNFPIGKYKSKELWVNPLMRWDDNRILFCDGENDDIITEITFIDENDVLI